MTTTDYNQKLIEKFLDNCTSRSIGKARVTKYRYGLGVISKLLGKEFDKATREDIEKLIATIERSHYSEWSKHDFKVHVKCFWKWLSGGEEYPSGVKWIKTTMKRSQRKLPEDILNEQEIKTLVEHATTIRDKAIISVLYESGCRIAEFLGLKIKNVEFDTYGAVIGVHGKTGSRRIRLINSVPYLASWINQHPERNNPNSSIWISIGTTNHGNLVTQDSIRKTIEVIAKRANVKKRINPHSFRHARATRLAKDLTEQQLKIIMGWSQASEMASVYVHLSGKDVDDAVLRMNGVKQIDQEKLENPLKPKICSRCDNSNPSTAKLCNRCGLALDIKEAMLQDEKLNALAQMITPEMIEDMIERKVQEILKNSIKL
ncbi:MAG: tyrosine-type recombinase/integrase [Candidatus Aenigmarchaeota archaeon]|nr:tyrosine-type recombinase/integrase [Candidatus Aenigmarchaeota archaeon]